METGIPAVAFRSASSTTQELSRAAGREQRYPAGRWQGLVWAGTLSLVSWELQHLPLQSQQSPVLRSQADPLAGCRKPTAFLAAVAIQRDRNRTSSSQA